MDINQKTSWDLVAKVVPPYAVLPLISCPLLNLIVYHGAPLLTKGRTHYDFTLPIDELIPTAPAWTIVYIGCFFVWIVNFILICRESQEICFDFLSSEAIAKLICGLFFVFLPTTNIRPELTGEDCFTWLLNLIYTLDRPVNLFPSIHCLDIWFAWWGLRKCRKVPRAYQHCSLLFMGLVFCSVLFTKQHVIVDILGGVFVAELGCLLAQRIPFTRLYYRMNAWIGIK